tara:strand:- start:5068 stop:5589 length:522 start_codon:yes stop_codon:yes gene_type:complete
MKKNELQARLDVLENKKAGAVSEKINNPWIIAVALVTVLLYVYDSQQSAQNTNIQSVSESVSELKLSVEKSLESVNDATAENTKAITVMAAAVSGAVKAVENNYANLRNLDDKMASMSVNRFTNKDGQDINEKIRDNELEFAHRQSNLEKALHKLSNEFATFKGMILRDENGN